MPPAYCKVAVPVYVDEPLTTVTGATYLMLAPVPTVVKEYRGVIVAGMLDKGVNVITPIVFVEYVPGKVPLKVVNVAVVPVASN